MTFIQAYLRITLELMLNDLTGFMSHSAHIYMAHFYIGGGSSHIWKARIATMSRTKHPTKKRVKGRFSFDFRPSKTGHRLKKIQSLRGPRKLNK